MITEGLFEKCAILAQASDIRQLAAQVGVEAAWQRYAINRHANERRLRGELHSVHECFVRVALNVHPLA